MEDAPLLAQTPACLGSLLLPAKLFFAGSQKPPQPLKSRPNRIGIWSFIINDLHRPTTQTLGHYWYTMTKVAVLDDWHGVARSSADWSPLMAIADVVFFGRAFENEDDAVDNLADFDIVLSMRERT